MFEWGVMKLPNGDYITKHGSEARIRDGQKTRMSFDWFEEQYACCDCTIDDIEDGYLVWSCDECEGGQAKLEIN